MQKFIHKHYMEVLAVMVVAAFWGSVWAYHTYQTASATAYQNAHTYIYSPNIADQ